MEGPSRKGRPFAFEAFVPAHRYGCMLVFLDFEASSLAKRSYPIEVAWVFEDGRSASHLIRPAPDWTDWDVAAEAIHGIDRARLLREGVAHDAVARQMVEQLSGHDLVASAPSWDGKWLSVLLSAAGFPRHILRVRDSDDALREAAEAVLGPLVGAARLASMVAALLARSERAPGTVPTHRALPDAEDERARWLAVRAGAQALAERLPD